MRLHPLHPMSVHAPVACILFTPLADLCAHLTGNGAIWNLGALTSTGGVAFGLIAATFGALDFERAYAKAPRTIISHLTAMVSAVALSGVSAFGRWGEQWAVASPAPLWAIAAGAAALCAMIIGAYFGGDLVYHHGVNVRRHD